ncbi:uncharacterized protein LOC110838230 [Zootermopsis nevadensis]|uniref:Torsin-2A n=1 Tax=Zootermopsis nevadensis TaxID=136037 RepID=A0A067QW05_ZOONE|nr:uncharacterized protein LOC110838230 [Zootermopsis nevadensis]KDR10137.1 Torsin-2A [Zootermopsis nevadensis]
MLNRSHSMSEFPVSKLVRTEELKHNDLGQPLIKHYSCEQILYGTDKIKIERIVQEVRITTDNISSWNSWAVKYESPVSSLKNFCEDQNKQSQENHHETFYPVERKNDNVAGSKALLRPLRLPPSNSTGQRKDSVLFVFLPIIFIVASVIACTSVYLASYQRVCKLTLDINAVKSVLDSSLFGQEDVIYNMVSTLQIFCSTKEPGIVIMALLGGTGVGKSYTTSIICNLFPWGKNVQHFVLPFRSNLLPVSDDYGKFSSCGDNLVVMDGLVPSDVDDTIKFLHNLMNHSKEHGIRVIVILVFSSEVQKMILEGYGNLKHELQVSKQKLSSAFQDAGLDVSLITFQPLEREHIVMCIKEALSQKGILWSSTEIERVMVLLPQDTGCKGVASKVQLFITSD